MSFSVQTSLTGYTLHRAISLRDAMTAERVEEAIHTPVLGAARKSDDAEATQEQARQDPRIEAASREMAQAKDKLVELAKELKRVKKIWGSQPKELAEQLVRLAKELQKTLKAYVKAQKAYQSLTGEMGGGLNLSIPSVSANGDASKAGDDAKSAEGDADTAAQEAEQSQADADNAATDEIKTAGETEDVADDAVFLVVSQFEICGV